MSVALSSVVAATLALVVSVAGPVALVREAFARFLDAVFAAVPTLLAGLVFLAVAAVLVRVAMVGVRAVLRRAFDDQAVYVRFAATVVAGLLWFGVVLSFLSVVGLEEIAAALGTATGFVALGVSYALSGMIADAVAGVYLLRDPDFNPGDHVTAGDTTGVVQSIELRKTRIAVDGDTVVRANAEIEKKWTKREADPQV